MPKVFLGGTCNDSKWRDRLINLLKPDIDCFNPVVDDWTETDRLKEIEERENSDFVLYVITPLMTGVYSIAEVVDDSNKRPEKTIFCILNKDQSTDGQVYVFEASIAKSLKAVSNMVEKNNAKVFDSLEAIAVFLNKN